MVSKGYEFRQIIRSAFLMILSYIKSGTRTSEVKLELLASGKKTTYIDVMSLNPKQAIEAKEAADTRIQNNQKFNCL